MHFAVHMQKPPQKLNHLPETISAQLCHAMPELCRRNTFMFSVDAVYTLEPQLLCSSMGFANCDPWKRFVGQCSLQDCFLGRGGTGKQIHFSFPSLTSGRTAGEHIPPEAEEKQSYQSTSWACPQGCISFPCIPCREYLDACSWHVSSHRDVFYGFKQNWRYLSHIINLA